MPPASPPPEALAPTEVIAYVLADLAIILLAARIVGGIFVRIRQPRVVGEIIAGILIGPTVIGGQLASGAITATDKPAVDGTGLVNDLFPLQAFSFLSLIGTLTLVFFMFLVGLEVQQRFLKGRERQILIVALAVIAAPVALGFLIGSILDGADWKVAVTPDGKSVSASTHALFLGAALAVTAFPVMARILQEKRMLSTPMGAIGVGAAAVVTPLMFIVVAAALASAKGEGVPNTVGVKILLAVGLTALLFFVVRPLLRLILERRFDPAKPLDDELFALLLFGALATGLAADRIGINALNGGFLFGACVPQFEGLGRAVIDRLQQFVVVFMIPIFLAVSGLQTDLRVLEVDLIGGILLFLVAMIVAKLAVGALAGRAVGLNWREANTIGTLMNCRGLMILVVAVIGKQAGVITDPMQVTFVIGAIVTTMMTGPLVDALVPPVDVEQERDKSVSGSLAGIPAMTGGPRVLIAPGQVDAAPAALEMAREYLSREGPAPQFLVADLPGLAADGDYVGAGPEEEETAVRRTLAWIRPLAEGLRAAGADAETASFQSPDPAADLAKLAAEWAATDAIVGPAEAAAQLEAGGVKVHRAGAATPALA
ncbi:MAG TPA: cation:proton antiporter [Solirubrobacterales bacterium]|nr:cation:proton antiporter [Actinomycetota bacterium]HYU61513.1 cation:proton antiporter [Solirubrobacterales bacterium]